MLLVAYGRGLQQVAPTESMSFVTMASSDFFYSIVALNYSARAEKWVKGRKSFFEFFLKSNRKLGRELVG